ncbi:MAG TPA: PAS-domain containing protein [Rhizomicrobium sp.]|nr:PAS-domain containing protein [Rhizomicrobium sp.]
MNLALSPALAALDFDDAAAPELVDALHCLRVAVTVFDSRERLVFANQHLNYLFRSLPPRDVLLGQSYEQLIRLEIAGGEIAKTDAQHAEAFIARRRAQLLKGDYRPLDIHLADGRTIEIKARRTRAGGWIALWSDVTEARISQTRLEEAVALTADAFAFFDKQDRVVVCNDAYAGFFGFASKAELLGRSFDELMERARVSKRIEHREPPDQWVARRIEAHRSPAGVMTVELKNGEAFVMRDRVAADGRVVIYTDISERRRAERALEEQTKTLAETRDAAAAQASYLADLTRRFDEASASADTTKTTLMRTMSHELKTPLNAIIGFSDLMLSMADRFTPDQVREYTTLIHEGGHNLLRLINQILDLTKLSAGRYELRRARIDAGAALWSAYGSFEAKAAARNLTVEVSAALDFVVDADEAVFSGMLAHLLDNAVNFTPAGGRIDLSVMRDGDRICIRVADNGPGVAQDDIARILLPFEQGGRGMTDHTSGAGLGLTLVHAFAEAHGGALAIESAAGNGFTATISLPAAA